MGRFIAASFAAVVVFLGAGVVCAQEYPAKVIRIVTSPPGGSNDFASRLLVKGLAERAGWQLVVDNRPTVLAPEVVMRTAPDGYTLLVTGGTFVTGYLIEKLPYEPLRDFAPISLTHRQPNILVVHPSLPVKSVKDLIALAKARPGELNYSSSGIGSTNHLAAELFKFMSGVRIVRINYKGVGPAVGALLSGEVQLMYANLASISHYLQAGRLRPLAITSAGPSPLYPSLPTMAASGLPGFEAVLMTGVYAPLGTPAAIVNRLNQEIVRAINLPDIREKFSNIGIETVGSSPQELTAAMKAEIARTARLVKEGGLRSE
ncbi:MAG: Bug family tripartite tricarboxylate transporter substrate binding protein [Burkholderiales bacterium]